MLKLRTSGIVGPLSETWENQKGHLVSLGRDAHNKRVTAKWIFPQNETGPPTKAALYCFLGQYPIFSMKVNSFESVSFRVSVNLNYLDGHLKLDAVNPAA